MVVMTGAACTDIAKHIVAATLMMSVAARGTQPSKTEMLVHERDSYRSGVCWRETDAPQREMLCIMTGTIYKQMQVMCTRSISPCSTCPALNGFMTTA